MHYRRLASTLPALLCFLCLASPQSALPQDFDLIVRGARIIDGTGNPWYRADIGLRGKRISEIGQLRNRSAKTVVEAEGLIAAPGFIDMMGGSSLPLILNPRSANSKLLEGVTTLLVGEGDSLAPQSDITLKQLQKEGHFAFNWHTYGEYFGILEEKGVGLNVIHNVGAAQVRLVVMGDQDRKPTADQLERMKQLVEQAMRDGSVGLSTALIYPPGSYATTEEIIELAKVAAGYGGVYFTHMRNESDQVLTAIQEAIRIGQEAHLPVHIYHLKAAGKENWPLVTQEVALIQDARDRGLDVSADAYPYIYNGIGLGSFINPRHFAQGAEKFRPTLSNPEVRRALQNEIETTSNWENWYRHTGEDWNNVLVAKVPAGANPKFEGLSIKQIASLRGVDPWRAFFDLVGQGETTVNVKSMNEDQKKDIYRRDFVSVSSDAEPADPVTNPYAHPRAFGTFPRILAKYVRSDKVISLEGAIRSMTSLPADQLQLWDRGRIAPGMAADLVVFDPLRVRDTATFAKPGSYPVGIEYVLVNGKIAVDKEKPTGVLAGEVIRHKY